MDLSKGCNYCKNLKCTKEPLLDFECGKIRTIKLVNCGGCFAMEINYEGNCEYIIVESCPDFEQNQLN